MEALHLLSGDAQAFREKVWASAVHLHRTDPAALVGFLSLDDVDHLLTGVALRTPALRVVRDGTVLPAAEITRSATMAGVPVTGLVDPRKVLAQFDAGATIVLQGLHRYWQPLTELTRALELELGHPCQANAYLTPPGSQGFARHSDTHDVFVFQTHGVKQWDVVDDETVRDVLLEPGLSMYLPTGTPHSARSQESTSLHVTVGINQVTWRQVLRGLTDRALAQDRFAGHLPAGYLDDPRVLVTGLQQALQDLTGSLAAVDPQALADERVAAFLSERTPVLRGGLGDRVLLAGLDDATVLERRPTSPCVLRLEGDRLLVLLGDRRLRMPGRLREPMAFVRDHARFTVGDLAPWLDAGSRAVVARRLVREGLLRIVR